ncbi:MAG: 2Fe-2S iron-sulfur cluster-binding protein [Hyphomicrobiaceae bacterium]
MTRVALTVNGKAFTAEVAPRTHLADFLRDQLLLTGTHIGCEHGICGACTVEIDGEIARSCITYAVACDGARVRTIEGFDDDALMGHLRQAFTEAHALQCGYCTPGMLIAARDLVRRKQGLSRADIRLEMSGNLCRCTGYAGIVDAIERVMAEPAIPATLPRHAEGGMDAHRRAGGASSARRGHDVDGWLGPPPGPVASPGSSFGVETRPAPPAALAPTPVQARPGVATPIEVTVGQMEEAGGTTRLSQSFVLPHPREAVWALMSDVGKVARCMPGLALDAPPQDGKVAGRLEARIGPIAASFAGEATIQRHDSEYRQVIEGRGGDKRSGSLASGSVDYRLSAATDATGRDATRVDVIISYALAGPLAQVGRSGLVRDLVRRIGEAFAQNLDAELRNPGGALPQAQLGGLSLLAQAIVDRVRAWFAHMLGRTR